MELKSYDFTIILSQAPVYYLKDYESLYFLPDETYSYWYIQLLSQSKFISHYRKIPNKVNQGRKEGRWMEEGKGGIKYGYVDRIVSMKYFILVKF